MPPGLDQNPPTNAGRSSLASKRHATGLQGRAPTPPNKRMANAVHPGIGVRLQPPAKGVNQTQTSQLPHLQSAQTINTRSQPFRGKPPHQRTDREGAALGNMTAVKPQAGQKQRLPAGMGAPKGALRTGKGNRLGQRARRALSEKLYGSKAKHVKQGSAQPHVPPQLHGSNAGGKSNQFAAGTPLVQHVATRPDHSSLQNHDRQVADSGNKPWGEPGGHRRGVVDESHPSWIAYRQQKAKLRLKPLGKKTIFTDDGGRVEAIADCAGPRSDPAEPGPVDGTIQPSQHVREDSGGLCAMARTEMNRGRGKNWGDAGRGTVAELLPVEQARGGDGKGGTAREPVTQGGRARNSGDIEDKMKGFHPSWIAAKQRKLQLAKLKVLSKAAPGANKIKFDD